jgi:hypothetical protein
LYPLLSRTYNNNKLENSNKEGLISYYKKNGITSLKKHVDANHTVITKNVGRRSKFFVERKRRKTTNK